MVSPFDETSIVSDLVRKCACEGVKKIECISHFFRGSVLVRLRREKEKKGTKRERERKQTWRIKEKSLP